MAYISQITLPSGNTYVLKDAKVRALLGFKDYEVNKPYSKGDYLFYNDGFYIVNESIIASANTEFADVNTTTINSLGADILARYDEIKSLIAGGIHYRGYTLTKLEDFDDTNPIRIADGTQEGYSYTAVAGDLVIYQDVDLETGDSIDLEFIFDGEIWNEFGSTGALKALAFADTASGTLNGTASVSANYTPKGSVSVTLADNSTASNVSFTRGNYTPAGSVSVTLGEFAQTPTEANLTKGDYTPEGTINVTNPTVTISTDAQAGDVSVITGIAAGGTDTLNKVSAGTAVAVATTDTAVAVAYQMKNTTGYATSFTTNGIKDVAVATETTSPEFNVPTNAISGGTISTDAQTGSSVVTGLAAQDATSLFYNATVENETLTFSATALTTGKLGFSGTAAQIQGYKLSKTNADTANVGVDTKDIIPAKSNGTITPVTVGDSVTVIKNNGLSSVYLGATATNGSATFVGTLADDILVTGVSYDKATANGATATFTGSEEADLKVTGGTYYKQVVGSTSFTGTADTINSTGTATGTVTVTPDPVQSGD